MVDVTKLNDVELQKLVAGDEELRASKIRQKVLLFVMSLTAICYVWCLPWLAHWCGDFPRADGMPEGHSCFAYRCEGYPSCDDSAMGVSVSGFIMTPPATGMMLLSFLWPLLHLLQIDEFVVSAHVAQGRPWTTLKLITYRGSMYVYITCFGLFCTCTANYFPTGHNVFLGLTFLTGAGHYLAAMMSVSGLDMRGVQIYLGFAIGSFLTVVVINVGGFKMKAINPYLFYIIEAIGLSAMAAYPNIFELELFAKDGVCHCSYRDLCDPCKPEVSSDEESSDGGLN